MKVTFRCKLSGNTVSFVNALDIECLRKDVNYEEVKYETKAETKSESTNHCSDAKNERQEGNYENEIRQEEVLKKKAGRPKKK